MSAPNSSPPVNRPRSLRRPLDLRRDGPRAALFLGILLVLDASLWFGLVRPARRQVAVLKTVQEQAQRSENSQRAALAEIKAVHERVTTTQKNIDKFYREMLATKEERLVPFQRELVKVGQEFNVAPERVAITYSELDKEGIDSLAFAFPLTGGYENLRRFLSRLEDLDQFLIVREVGLAGGKEGGQALQLSVVVETYFNAPQLREEKEKAAGSKGRRTTRGAAAARRGGGR